MLLRVLDREALAQNVCLTCPKYIRFLFALRFELTDRSYSCKILQIYRHVFVYLITLHPTSYFPLE